MINYWQKLVKLILKINSFEIGLIFWTINKKINKMNIFKINHKIKEI